MTGQLSTQIELEVPFHDVDSMGVVWHGHYVKYFEIARCALLDSFSFGYTEMGRSEYAWPVVETRVRYVQPLQYRQRFTVQAILTEWDLRLKISYLIRDKDTKRRLTKGYTVQSAVDRDKNELVMPLPAILSEKVQAHLDSLG